MRGLDIVGILYVHDHILKLLVETIVTCMYGILSALPNADAAAYRAYERDMLGTLRPQADRGLLKSSNLDVGVGNVHAEPSCLAFESF
jgi:hypothetical protein